MSGISEVPRIRTAFTEMFGVEHPIACGGMTAVGTADLIAAVANAGALGFLTALSQPTPDALVHEIRRCQGMTEKPFGVNLTIAPTIHAVPYEDYLQAIIESGVKVVETAGNNPAPYLPALQAAGVKVIHKAVSVRHALKAEALGVDAVSIDGFECAGHPGDDDIPGLVLIPAAARRLQIPVIASGGIANGAGLVAALALGACAVNMGTRFMATHEAPIHPNVKRQIVENNELSSVVIFREFGNTARAARNSVSEEIARVARTPGATFNDVAPLASGERGRRAVYGDGDTEGGLWWASMAQGLIHEVASTADVVAQIMNEAADVAHTRIGRVFGPALSTSEHA